MPNQDLFKAYQKGIKETQKNNLNNPLSPVWERVRVRGIEENHPHLNLPPSRGKRFFDGTLFTTFSENYEKLTSLSRRVRRALQKKWKHSLAGIALVLALGGTPAMGDTFNVGGGDVDALRNAINMANGNSEDDTIVLDGSTFTLPDSPTLYDFNGNNGLPVITSTITIEGNGSTIERNTANMDEFRIILVDGGDLTLNETSITGGFASGTRDEGDGGGIFIEDGGMTLSNSTLSDNEASENGGGIYVSFNVDVGVSILNSTVTGNNAGDNGGGIYHDGGGLLIVNSTISDNEAVQDGGGMYIISDSNEFIINSTITGNTAGSEGGGVYNENSEDIIITNSIISGNTANSVSEGYNCYGGFTDGGNNLSDDGNNDFSAMNSSDYFCFDPSVTNSETTFDSDNCLGSLADNGGPTQTMALISSGMNGCTTNLAIGGGNDATCTSDPVNSVDQRGIPRPQMVSCDIGAFELIDQNNNGVDDCLELGEFGDEDGNGVADNCDALINPEELITPAPTMSQWGMIAFGFIAGLFGIRFLRKRNKIQEA